MLRSGRLSRALALIAAFLLLIALVITTEIGQRWQKQIDQSIGLSEHRDLLFADLVGQLSAAVAAQRGFLLTGDSKYLPLYETARSHVEPLLDRLDALLRSDSRFRAGTDELDSLQRLRALINAELGELAASQALYTSRGPEQALNLIRTEFGSRTMSAIQDQVRHMRADERLAVNAAIARAEQLRIASRLLTATVVALNIVLLIVAATLLGRQAQRREQFTRRLASENEELERRVRRRTAELSALSSHLQRLSEKEKAALARELHDELGGLLIAAKMDISWLLKRWPNPEPDIQARWTRVLLALDEGVDFKRRIVENLRPTLLDNMGLLPAVRWITQETCSRAGLHCTEVHPESEPDIAGDAAIAVFRLVQESLTNIVKHAQATQVHVEIRVRDGQLCVLIEDNGVGIDADRSDAIGSHGLATMRHRVRSFGGVLEIGPAELGGTRVRAVIPLAAIQRAAPQSDTTRAASA